MQDKYISEEIREELRGGKNKDQNFHLGFEGE